MKMRIDKDILSAVLEWHKERVLANEIALTLRRRKLYAENADIARLDQCVRESVPAIARAVAAGQKADIAAIAKKAAQMQKERDALLVSLGYPADHLTYKHLCARCADTGFVEDDRLCDCLMQEIRLRQSNRLSSMLDTSDSRFEAFSLSFYSDETAPELGISHRENMEMNLDICKEFAARFGEKPQNLLLNGSTGLGKTFLSGAIAREVSAKGFSVVYDSAAAIFAKLDATRFDRADDPLSGVAPYLSCDLFILDDLGCEAPTQFSVASLYHIINARLLGRLSTIINTNLTLGQLRERYSPQIYSRLRGEYIHLYFSGDDIRVSKAQ